MGTVRSVVIVGYDEVEMLDIACPADVFDAANRVAGSTRYRIRLASLRGGPIDCQNGLRLADTCRLDSVTGPVDTLVVAGGMGHLAAAADLGLVNELRRLAGHSRRVASVCAGATPLAATGLLDGRRVTTHWYDARRLAAAHPRITVDPAPLYVRDGPVYTSAGVTAGLDLALRFVQDDCGPRVARMAARVLVTYVQRPANQAQISMFVDVPPSADRTVAELVAHVVADPAGDLSVAALAARAGVGARQLGRLFATELGVSPARFVRAARTELAAQLLATTDIPLATVARRCGLGSPETLRQAFADTYRTTPARYRAALRNPSDASAQ